MNGSFYNNPTFPSAQEEKTNEEEKTFCELLTNRIKKKITIIFNQKEIYGTILDIKQDYLVLSSIPKQEKYYLKKDSITGIKEE